MPSQLPATFDTLDLLSPAGDRRLSRFGVDAIVLGKGGAGTVFAHPELPGLALKIYGTTERADAHEAKVRAMVATPPKAVRTPNGTVQIAWPSATVTHAGRFVGFVMPIVEFARAWTLQQLIQPTQRARRGIPERMDLRLYAGLNLATVLRSLHAIGHCVIDLKPQNVLVYRDDSGASAAHVALVDCDGFQVRGPNGARYDAELATTQFLHPDVAARVGDEATFDPRRINDQARLQDDFALAIILFQLLNNGLHPMMGRETGALAVPSDLATRLQGRGRYYAYARDAPNPAMLPDLDSFHHWFDPALRDLFDRAFSGAAQPPTPRDWAGTLGRIASPGQRCSRDPDHWKLGPICGFCARAAARAAPTAAPPVPAPPPPRRDPVRRGRAIRRQLAPAILRMAMLGAAIWVLPGFLRAWHLPRLPFVAALAESPAFREGLVARQVWESEFEKMTGEARDGALFWTTERSSPSPVSCNEARGHASFAFRQGCLHARALLTPTDTRRKTDPDYRRGWNSF